MARFVTALVTVHAMPNSFERSANSAALIRQLECLMCYARARSIRALGGYIVGIGGRESSKTVVGKSGEFEREIVTMQKKSQTNLVHDF